MQETSRSRKEGPGNAVSRQARRGQVLPIVALSMFALIAIIGLAIDGGSLFTQRRVSQNAADGASMAGTRAMLDAYNVMVGNNPSGDVDGSGSIDIAIKYMINEYVTTNGGTEATYTAYYVDDERNIIDTGGCSGPCEVGESGAIPWSQNYGPGGNSGAKGIRVSVTTDAQTLFMGIFGWDIVQTRANSSAFMGPAVDLSYPDPGPTDTLPRGVLPMTFNKDAGWVNSLQAGVNYELANGTVVDPNANGDTIIEKKDAWGWINFTGNLAPSPQQKSAWFGCGFNPDLANASEWGSFCPPYNGVGDAHGQVLYYTGSTFPDYGPSAAPRIRWGADGWWLLGTPAPGITCAASKALIEPIVGKSFIVAFYDSSLYHDPYYGGATFYRNHYMGWFTITQAEVVCGAGGPLPVPFYDSLEIRGDFHKGYSTGSTGTHGDVRHASLQVVFLEPEFTNP